MVSEVCFAHSWVNAAYIRGRETEDSVSDMTAFFLCLHSSEEHLPELTAAIVSSQTATSR